MLQEKAFDDGDEWCLLADELSLLPGMTDTGRLGFALQLKFRQIQPYTSSTQSNKTPYLPGFHSTVRLPSIIFCQPKNRGLSE